MVASPNMPLWMCAVREQLVGLSSLLQVIRLGSMYLYPSSHFAFDKWPKF